MPCGNNSGIISAYRTCNEGKRILTDVSYMPLIRKNRISVSGTGPHVHGEFGMVILFIIDRKFFGKTVTVLSGVQYALRNSVVYGSLRSFGSGYGMSV